MAIQIVRSLSVSPNPAALPKRVELSQTLRSNLAAEKIRVSYSLEAAHNVFFVDGDDPPSKTFSRSETVGRTDQVCVDRVTLEIGAGEGPMASITIRQAITDSIGLTITDLVILRLQS